MISVEIPILLTDSAPDTARENPIFLSQGLLKVSDVSEWFQGGDGDFASFTTRIEVGDANVPNCVTPTISGTTLTLTPHNDNTQPACTIQFAVGFTDDGGAGNDHSFLFWITIPVGKSIPYSYRHYCCCCS